ncbi:hypothetical protein Salat_1180600 [Sesamum alatum]|uniref:Uncharacterized protein n=1 Tax=Sesamum alatum TaxID=300844 RepID=A0AAE2CNM6_9LAMI|nr:hypothetical protein Salat_1180600 [Sesamum alatum]
MGNTKRPKARKGYTQRNPARPNGHALDFAIRNLEDFSGKNNPRDLYVRKLNLLRLLYDTFHCLLHDPAFTWRVETNRLIAEKDAWKRVYKQNLFAKAYRYRGEPKWWMLAVIFDPTGPWDEETEETEEVHESNGDGDSSADDPILDSGVVCRRVSPPPTGPVIELSSDDDEGK